jgi:uncharacterized membrane protein (UPF0127 family)
VRRTALLLATLLPIAACSGGEDPDPIAEGRTHEVVIRTADGEVSLTVEVADSDDERARGLMGVTDLPANEGMAFVFDEQSTGTFWMEGTLIPLAIAFVGENGHILGISEMTPCRTDPCPTYSSPAPYTWAVETNAGWFAANGVRAGDEAVLLERG